MKYWFLGLFALICLCNVSAIDSRMVGDWYDGSSLALKITQGEILIYPQIVDSKVVSFIYEEPPYELRLQNDGISAYVSMNIGSRIYQAYYGISIQFCPLFDNVLLVIVDSSYGTAEMVGEGEEEHIEDGEGYASQRTYLLMKH
jgi:hypothetical protein